MNEVEETVALISDSLTASVQFNFTWLPVVCKKLYLLFFAWFLHQQLEGQKFLAENSASVYIQKVCKLAAFKLTFAM